MSVARMSQGVSPVGAAPTFGIWNWMESPSQLKMTPTMAAPLVTETGRLKVPPATSGPLAPASAAALFRGATL